MLLVQQAGWHWLAHKHHRFQYENGILHFCSQPGPCRNRKRDGEIHQHQGRFLPGRMGTHCQSQGQIFSWRLCLLGRNLRVSRMWRRSLSMHASRGWSFDLWSGLYFRAESGREGSKYVGQWWRVWLDTYYWRQTHQNTWIRQRGSMRKLHDDHDYGGFQHGQQGWRNCSTNWRVEVSKTLVSELLACLSVVELFLCLLSFRPLAC